MNANELGLIRNNHEDAVAYDEEHGGPLALMHCVRDVPQLLTEVERLRKELAAYQVAIAEQPLAVQDAITDRLAALRGE